MVDNVIRGGGSGTGAGGRVGLGQGLTKTGSSRPWRPTDVSAKEAADLLVSTALGRGSGDNVTAIVVVSRTQRHGRIGGAGVMRCGRGRACRAHTALMICALAWLCRRSSGTDGGDAASKEEERGVHRSKSNQSSSVTMAHGATRRRRGQSRSQKSSS